MAAPPAPRYPFQERRDAVAEKHPAPERVGIPAGYVRLDWFNQNVNVDDRYGLKGRIRNEQGVWVKVYKGRILLWWADPAIQIDRFAYFGDRQADIDQCDAQTGMQRAALNLNEQHTWHHTGYPHEEAGGTMQYVPTFEHEALPHIGGVAISKGKY